MRRILTVLVLLVGAAAAATAQLPVTRQSRPLRLLHSWYDSIKTPKGDVARRVDIVYDYARAAALEQVYTLDGRLLTSRRIVVNPPTPSAEEVQEAFEIIRADAEMALLLWRHGGELEGGFLIEEG